MIDPITYFITWTTYGTWLPGDSRGWRKIRQGNRPPQPKLETWCRERMSESEVILNETQRDKVENVCREHAAIRGWILHAVNARSNHVHLAVSADKGPKVVRDQFKANTTRRASAGTRCDPERKNLDERGRLRNHRWRR